MNDITIVIPNYNGYRFLRDCLDSLYENTSINFDLIIVDNNSNDGDYYEILEFYPHIDFIKLDKNYGFSYAVNIGIKKATTKYVVLLNNDTVIIKDWLENLKKTIESNPNIFSVCSKMIRMHEKNIIDDAGDEYNILGWAYKRFDGKDINFKNANKMTEVFSSCGGAVIYKREVFEKIGYFDENFFAYMEDVDISYRAKIYGYKNIYCHSACIYHIGSGTSGSKYNEFKVKLAARNNIYVPYKNMPLLQLIINIPFLFVGYLVKYLFFIKKGFGKVYLSGIKEGLNTLGKTEKTKFSINNIPNYIIIELLLIKNTFSYVYSKIIK